MIIIVFKNSSARQCDFHQIIIIGCDRMLSAANTFNYTWIFDGFPASSALLNVSTLDPWPWLLSLFVLSTVDTKAVMTREKVRENEREGEWGRERERPTQ